MGSIFGAILVIWIGTWFFGNVIAQLLGRDGRNQAIDLAGELAIVTFAICVFGFTAQAFIFWAIAGLFWLWIRS